MGRPPSAVPAGRPPVVVPQGRPPASVAQEQTSCSRTCATGSTPSASGWTPSGLDYGTVAILRTSMAG